MSDNKKTEDQLRHDIRKKFSFSEERDKERIDGMLDLKKENYKTRMKNKELMGDKKSDDSPGSKVEEPKGTDTLSVKDGAFLQQNDVPTEDWDEVVDFARYKKVSVQEALKSNVLKATLKENAEERTSSKVIQTNKKRSGSQKLDGHKLHEKAKSTGELPESDEGMEALIDARHPTPKDR